MKKIALTILILIIISCNQKQVNESSKLKANGEKLLKQNTKLIDFSYTINDDDIYNPNPNELKTKQKGDTLFVSFKKSEGYVTYNGDIQIKNDSLFLVIKVDESKKMLKEETNYIFNYKIENKERKNFKIKIIE